jgi:hypothetical protein
MKIFPIGMIAFGVIGGLPSTSLADLSKCDCTIKKGTCTVTSATFKRDTITFTVSTNECANFNWRDGDYASGNGTAVDGSDEENYSPADPNRKPNITTDSCTKCKTNP